MPIIEKEILRICIETYMFNNFIQNSCFIWFGSIHVPLINVNKFAQLLDIFIFLFASTFFIITFVDLWLWLWMNKNSICYQFYWQIIRELSDTYFVFRASTRNFLVGCRWTCHCWCNRVHYFRRIREILINLLIVWCLWLHSILIAHIEKLRLLIAIMNYVDFSIE